MLGSDVSGDLDDFSDMRSLAGPEEVKRLEQEAALAAAEARSLEENNKSKDDAEKEKWEDELKAGVDPRGCLGQMFNGDAASKREEYKECNTHQAKHDFRRQWAEFRYNHMVEKK